MDADEPVSRLDVVAECVPLGCVQNIAGRIEEHDGPVSHEIGGCEGARVFRRIDGEPVRGAQLLQDVYGMRNRVVAKAESLREDEHPGRFGPARLVEDDRLVAEGRRAEDVRQSRRR